LNGGGLTPAAVRMSGDNDVPEVNTQKFGKIGIFAHVALVELCTIFSSYYVAYEP
jgi:hypothetical protein